MDSTFKITRITRPENPLAAEDAAPTEGLGSRSSSGYASLHPDHWKRLVAPAAAPDQPYDVGQLLENMQSAPPQSSQDAVQALLGNLMVGAEAEHQPIKAHDLGIKIPDVPSLMNAPAAFDQPESVLDKLLGLKKEIVARLHERKRAIIKGGLSLSETKRYQEESRVLADAQLHCDKQIKLAEEYVAWAKHREELARARARQA